MGYHIGVDLGTTFSAAAVVQDGTATITTLGTDGAAIPSVVLVGEDGIVLTGDAAARRAVSEPHRVAREFKRRIGDTTPLVVGGVPYSAEALSAHLLRDVLAHVIASQAERPDGMAITHPANWGDYKVGLLGRVVELAGVDPQIVRFVAEPEAAAIAYAMQSRVEPGEVYAVYDLVGGTFDAAVLRRTAAGFELLGRPEGIERLGGVDIDAAIMARVVEATTGAPIHAHDETDPGRHDPTSPRVRSGQGGPVGRHRHRGAGGPARSPRRGPAGASGARDHDPPHPDGHDRGGETGDRIRRVDPPRDHPRPARGRIEPHPPRGRDGVGVAGSADVARCPPQTRHRPRGGTASTSFDVTTAG